MDLNQYQISTRATSPGKRDRSPEDDARLLPVFGLGVAGEAGEVADLIKKHVGHGHPLDVSKLKYELGDVLWYVAALADICGLTLDDVAAANIEKLRARYPEGFSSERSINRAPVAPAARNPGNTARCPSCHGEGGYSDVACGTCGGYGVINTSPLRVPHGPPCTCGQQTTDPNCKALHCDVNGERNRVSTRHPDDDRCEQLLAALHK